MYPLLFKPIYKDYLWGGDKIARLFHRPNTPKPCAESWEISDRQDGASVVSNGPLAGSTLGELLTKFGREIMGEGKQSAFFPLLVKLIDAKEKLSVQVHPDDETARNFGGEAKTESWYVVAAEPGAKVYMGLKAGVNQKAFQAAMDRGQVEDTLNVVSVAAGDMIYIPGGRVHAIGAGCLMLEVQQNSNTTYRLYDWKRVAADGRPRELHVEKAMRVIRWHDEEVVKATPKPLDQSGGRCLLLSTPYFRLEKMFIAGEVRCQTPANSWQIIFVEKGAVDLNWEGSSLHLALGTTCLIPASVAQYSLQPKDGGKAEVITVSAPEN